MSNSKAEGLHWVQLLEGIVGKAQVKSTNKKERSEEDMPSSRKAISMKQISLIMSSQDSELHLAIADQNAFFSEVNRVIAKALLEEDLEAVRARLRTIETYADRFHKMQTKFYDVINLNTKNLSTILETATMAAFQTHTMGNVL